MKDSLLQREFRDRAVRAKRFLFLLDFDGTLSSIVRDPDQARLGKSHVSALRRLRRHRYVSIVILSGRPKRELVSRIPVRGMTLIGEHGLEVADLRQWNPRDWKRCLQSVRRRVEALVAEERGARLEVKSRSLTIHFREVRAGRQRNFHFQIQELLKVLSRSNAFRIRDGKKILEVLPPVAWGKGEVASRIAKKASPNSLLVAIGDDETDEEMFRILRGALCVKVGRGKSAAPFRLSGPPEVARFLSWAEKEIVRKAK